jgi:hypothetical protein
MLQCSFRIAAIRAGRSIFIRGMTAVRTLLALALDAIGPINRHS